MLQIDATSFLHFALENAETEAKTARDVFYDERSRTVFTVTSNEHEILVRGRNKDQTIQMSTKAAPHSVLAVRLAPQNGGVLAVQRAPNIVEFRNVIGGAKGQEKTEVKGQEKAEVKGQEKAEVRGQEQSVEVKGEEKPTGDGQNLTPVDPESYWQSAKGKGEILGMEFVGPQEIVFVTDAGLELFQIVPGKRAVKSLKIYNVSVKWFVYSSQCQMLIIAAGTHGNLIYPFHVKGASLMKLPKFEIELFANPQRQSTRILEQDVALALLYGDVYVLVLRHNPRPGTKGADILMYKMERENAMEAKMTSLLSMEANGRFGMHIIDNLVVVHEQTKKSSYVFDIATNGTISDDRKCMVHEPVLANERISAIECSEKFGEPQSEEKIPSVPGKQPFFKSEDLYADTWSLFQPNVIVDSSRGFLCEVSLDLARCIDSLSSDSIRLVEFLIHRREGRKVLLNYLRDAIDNRSVRLDQWILICTRINGIYHSCLQAMLANPNPANPGNLQPPTLNQKSVNGPMERFSNCLVIDQTAIHSRVFFPLSDSKKVDKNFLTEVIIAYLYSLHAKGLDTESFLYELLVQSLVRSGQLQRLLQLLQYHVLPESKPLAFLLLSLEGQYPPMFNLAVDLLLRLNAYEEIVEIFLSKKKVLQALRFAQLTNCLETLDPMKFCEIAFLSGNTRHFLTVFRYFQQRSMKLKGSSVFGKGEAYEKFARCFEELDGAAG